MKQIIFAVVLTAITAASVSANFFDGGGVDQRSMRGVYLFSLRPELTVVFNEITSVGIVGEAGMVDDNGLFYTIDFCGGANYLGGGFNMGYAFNSRYGIKNAIGYSFGYYNTDIVVNFEAEDGELIKRDVGNYAGVVGLFWKVKWGMDGHLDVTNRLMFGYANNSVRYEEGVGVYSEKGFNASYSLSVGYTFVRRK